MVTLRGGEHTRYPDIRRVGVAFVRVSTSGSLLFAGYFPLMGEIQTVARGELSAVVELIRLAQHDTVICFVTDNKVVYDNYNAGMEVAALRSDCDLYAELFQMSTMKNIALTLRWMPSHLKDPENTKVRPDDVTDIDIDANDLDNKYATDAAALHKVSLQTATNCLYYYSLTRKIQLRLVAIMQNLPVRLKHKTVRTPAEEKTTLEQKCRDSSHAAVKNGDRVMCTTCLDSFRIRDPAFEPWLAGLCTPSPNTNRPSHFPTNKVLHVGNRYTHLSHRLDTHRGLVYCRKCGCRATNQVRLMGKRCSPPGRNGKATLKAILSDRLPPGMTEWPE
jgi:hypothetical protein